MVVQNSHPCKLLTMLLKLQAANLPCDAQLSACARLNSHALLSLVSRSREMCPRAQQLLTPAEPDTKNHLHFLPRTTCESPRCSQDTNIALSSQSAWSECSRISVFLASTWPAWHRFFHHSIVGKGSHVFGTRCPSLLERWKRKKKRLAVL